MDEIVTDVVSTPVTTKVVLDANFLIGAVATLTVVGAVVAGRKLVKKIKAARAEETTENELR